MANCAWSELFPSGYCEYLCFEGSEHMPLVNFFDQDVAKKKGSFDLIDGSRKFQRSGRL